MNKKILIVGIGGRTGAMFAKELEGAGEVYGAGLDREIDLIEEKKVFIEKNGEKTVFTPNAVRSREFEKMARELAPDFVFLATRNPVDEAVKFYYRAFAKIQKFPVLVLSQNGLSAGGDARAALNEILGTDAKKVKIIRLSLFNPINAQFPPDGTFIISYSAPVQLCYGVHSGGDNAADLREVFSNTKIDAAEVAAADTRNMEYSKLFLNLIGMASAVRGKSVKEGFGDAKIFSDEMEAIREYAFCVKKAGGKFLTFSNYSYPVGLIVWGLALLPVPVFSLFRTRLAGIVGSKRDNKPKDILEIDYYNGDIVKLARQSGLKAPVNEKILAAGKELLKIRAAGK